MDLSIDQWILTQGGPYALLAFLVWKLQEAQSKVAEEIGQLRGMIGVYINGRNNTSKKNHSN